MLDLLKEYQLDIMLVLTGICGITAFFVSITGILSKKRKWALMLAEIYATILLASDRLAYIYRGDVSLLGYRMVRVSNFLVFFTTLSVVHAMNMYITDLMLNEGGYKSAPFRLRLCGVLIIIGELMVIISQFTGLYYTFDSTNHYMRAPGFILGYIFPGVVMILQLSIIFQNRGSFRSKVCYPLMFFYIIPMIAAVVQLFIYGISFIEISMVGMAVLLYAFVLVDINNTIMGSHKLEVEYLKKQQKSMHKLFKQTATALANAIDAKDKYTRGHSSRVADYSRRIAEELGKSEEECEEIYFAALLHDVGKIGVPDYIINKEGKLTDEEFAEIQNHPDIGNNILSSIREYPYLSIGAHHHHERYDGQGYPARLKGEDIPEIARIVSVADAYDAMTSKRSYRDAITQSRVREEIIKGAGTQFDPEIANIMQHLIDLDTEYELRERVEAGMLSGEGVLVCEEYRSNVSEGILIAANKVSIKLKYTPRAQNADEKSGAAFLLFDSNDGHPYDDERKRKELHYFEYGEIMFDGKTVISGARDMQTSIIHGEGSAEKTHLFKKDESVEYNVEAVRIKDHALIKIGDGRQTAEVTVALPDNTRFLYLGLTGQYCRFDDVRIEKSEETTGEGYIKRIAEEISFINVPEGDIPNVQIDGYRTDATGGIPITDGLKISFHSMSLPTANLIWHCPYISIFYSSDGKINGEGYREFALIRFDGEYWESDEAGQSEIFVRKSDEFEGWEKWKKIHKNGIDSVVTFAREGSTITTTTENLGISIKNVTKITDDTKEIYAGITGDQVALTGIRIKTRDS